MDNFTKPLMQRAISRDCPHPFLCYNSPMANYEIEIKSLIGDRGRADELVAKMQDSDPNFISLGKHKQLNHYFIKGDIKALKSKLAAHLPADKQSQIDKLIRQTKDCSVRTRWADGKVIFVNVLFSENV